MACERRKSAMKKHLPVSGILAIIAYVAAAIIAQKDDGYWVSAIVCFLMCVKPHPAKGHFFCSLSLVLWALIYAGHIDWMADYVPTFVTAICLVWSTNMCEEAKKPLQIPEWESNGKQDRINKGLSW